MSGSIQITLTGKDALVARLTGADGKVMALLEQDLGPFAVDLREDAAARAGSRSGRLSTSIQAVVQLLGSTRVQVLLESQGVPYAAIQERGGTIPPRIISAKGHALAFLWTGAGTKAGDSAFFAHVNWPGATIRPKAYILTALRNRKAEFLQICQAAIARSMT